MDRTLLHCKLQKEEVLRVVSDTVSLFKENLYNADCEVFVSGSFARNSNRIHSDLDLNFLYNDEYKSKMTIIEEVICCCITQIMGIKRDQIHNMMMHAIDEEFILSRAQKFRIIFPHSKYIEYSCRDNAAGVLKCNKSCPRDKQSFIEHITTSINKNVGNEWCFTFKSIYHNANNVFDLLANAEKYSSIDGILKDLILKRATIQKSMFVTERNTTVLSDIKKVLKCSVYSDFFDVLSLFRKIVITKYGCKPFNLNLMEIYYNRELEELFTRSFMSKYRENIMQFFKYHFYIMRFEKALAKNGQEMSVHSTEFYNDRTVTEIYNSIFDENLCSVIRYLQEKRKNLYKKNVDFLNVMQSDIKKIGMVSFA